MYIKINGETFWEDLADKKDDIGWQFYRFASSVKPFNLYSIKVAQGILSEIISYYDQCWVNNNYSDSTLMDRCRKEASKYHIPIMYMGRLENLYELDYEFLKNIRWQLTVAEERKFVWELEKFAFEGV